MSDGKTLKVVFEHLVCTHYLSALINDDWSGLDDDDERHLTDWLNSIDTGHSLQIKDNSEEEFARDSVTGLMANCEMLEVWDWVKSPDYISGEKLIEILQLKVKPNGRVDTDWGDKTPLGLYLTVARIIESTFGGRKPTEEERAAIVELFDGYDPSILIVFDHYISDGPGYRGWIAITVGGEPHYCATFTKDQAGEIEICCEARDIGLECVDFPEEARP